MNKKTYQSIVENLAKQPPMIIQVTPLEAFLLIEALLYSFAAMTNVNSAVKDFLNRMFGALNNRYPRIANVITTDWFSQLKP